MDEISAGQSPDKLVLDLSLKSKGTSAMLNVLLRETLDGHGLLDLFGEAADAFTELVSLGLTAGPVKVKIQVEIDAQCRMSIDMHDDGPEPGAELRGRIATLTGGTWARRRRAGGGHRLWAMVPRTRGE